MPARIVRTAGGPSEERLFDFVYQPITDADGRVTGIFVKGRDVTGRHTAETRVEEVQRRLDAVLNNASVAIFLMDERQHCAYMNRAAEELTGSSQFWQVQPFSSGAERPPLGKGGGADLLVELAAGEAPICVEEVVD